MVDWGLRQPPIGLSYTVGMLRPSRSTDLENEGSVDFIQQPDQPERSADTHYFSTAPRFAASHMGFGACLLG